MTHKELHIYLLDWVQDWPSQSEASRQLGVSRSHLNHVLAGRKAISEHIAAKLGFKTVVSYELKRKPCAIWV